MEERSNDGGLARYNKLIFSFVLGLIAALVPQHLQLVHEDRRELKKERREAAVAFLAAVTRDAGTAGEGLRMIKTASIVEGKTYLEHLRADREAMQTAWARLTVVATTRHEVAMCRLLTAMNTYMDTMTLAAFTAFRPDEEAERRLGEASAKFESARIAFSYAVRE